MSYTPGQWAVLAPQYAYPYYKPYLYCDPRYAMCHAYIIKRKSCNHQWLQLQQPCAYGHNLMNCPMFQDQAVTFGYGKFRTIEVPDNHICPFCDLRGAYDIGQTRMILGQSSGIRIGAGPSALFGGGFEIQCTIM
ncbi:hypothetical protein BT63DRAFT_121878 [Microthyrium microscopicum]|uniref:Uncharacterized protein n=1 Tax=Microthyrium microscopicum TaxID=703497 RepID=A0A6A6TWL6_9PEZI|nr:hypothetical protein BT63DRAFT_121878 [Microthyrium microscopicum]